tara:strand:+ start:153 stop:761 length:609 start_codon:yes stop_codon:yes gene_type:complete
VSTQILLVGDSFAVNHSDPATNNYGWSFLLEQQYNITNISQRGVSEYKIIQQLKSINLKKFDCVIVSHTSPNRVYVDQHPVHYLNNDVYSNTDLIYNDIYWNLKKYPNNAGILAANYYFDKFYNQDYQEFIYQLFQKEITEMLKNNLTLHLLTLYDKNIDLFQNVINLYQQIEIDPGNINHYSAKHNQVVFNLVSNWVNQHV